MREKVREILPSTNLNQREKRECALISISCAVGYLPPSRIDSLWAKALQRLVLEGIDFGVEEGWGVGVMLAVKRSHSKQVK